LVLSNVAKVMGLTILLFGSNGLGYIHLNDSLLRLGPSWLARPLQGRRARVISQSSTVVKRFRTQVSALSKDTTSELADLITLIPTS